MQSIVDSSVGGVCFLFGEFGRRLREVYPRRVLIGIVIIGLLGGLAMWGLEAALPRVFCAVVTCHEPTPAKPGDVIMDGVGQYD